MQTSEGFTGSNGKTGVVITSYSGDRVCLDWYAYDSSKRLIAGGDGPTFSAEELPAKYEAVRAKLLKAIA
jgi:hypothetical protein